MNERKINLEEILDKHYNLWYPAYSVWDKEKKFTSVVDKAGAINAMKELAEELLELAAENATARGSMGLALINRDSILDTINQIE